MKKTKHNPPEKRGKLEQRRTVEFSKMQRAYINEILARQQKEFSDALGVVYEDLGITEKILKAPPGTFVLRKDFSGLDIFPVVTVPKIESGKPSEKPVSEKEAESKEKPTKEKTH